jgi:hypothetical protein
MPLALSRLEGRALEESLVAELHRKVRSHAGIRMWHDESGHWKAVTPAEDDRVCGAMLRMCVIGTEMVDGLRADGWVIRRADQFCELVGGIQDGDKHSIDMVMAKGSITVFVEVKWNPLNLTYLPVLMAGRSLMHGCAMQRSGANSCTRAARGELRLPPLRPSWPHRPTHGRCKSMAMRQRACQAASRGHAFRRSQCRGGAQVRQAVRSDQGAPLQRPLRPPTDAVRAALLTTGGRARACARSALPRLS